MLIPTLDHHVSLPDYVIINSTQTETTKAVLRTPARPFTFPLSKEDLASIATLVAKYDQEKNIAGLAAPQIGIPRQAIIFEAPDDPALKKWRPDLEQTIPKTIWLNPSYEPIGTEKHEDHEGCFSVQDLAGLVKRYQTIRYHANDIDGNVIEGIATGFLARIIQHETDHIHGHLFIDYALPQSLLSIEEYRKKRAEAME